MELVTLLVDMYGVTFGLVGEYCPRLRVWLLFLKRRRHQNVDVNIQ